MRFPRLLVFLVMALIAAAPWGSSAYAQAQGMPFVSTGPQQTASDGIPSVYPSTLAPLPSASTSSPNGSAWPESTGSDQYNSSGVSLSLGTGLSAAEHSGVYAPAATQYGGSDAPLRHLSDSDELWSWQILPTGLMYSPYLAGGREPRLGGQLVYERHQGWLLDATLGGQAGVLRYGTGNDSCPQGWQLDIEGAAFPRLDQDRDLVENDYRVGVPLTTRQGPWELKIGYNHYCSHIGDLYLLANPDFQRINYVHDSILWGVALHLSPDIRVYSEAGWAFRNDGGAEPWEFQFGAEFSPTVPTGIRGSPFFAVNGHLHQEDDFGGNMIVQTGWQWRGCTGHLLRIGVQYFNGMSDQAQFFNKFEESSGMGLWYDF